MLTALETLAWNARMRKVILTVFLSNTAARAFYTRCGYTIDPTSPDSDDDEAAPYVLLSKTSPAVAK